MTYSVKYCDQSVLYKTKMYCDLPLLRRCCFCLPLRSGLIAWGYLKMTIDMVLMAFASLLLSDSIWLRHSHMTIYHNTPCVIWSSLIVFLVVDVIFDFIFLLATHTSNFKLMRSSLYYNIFLFIISNIAFFLVLGYIIVNINSTNSLELLMTCFIIGFVNAVLQFYIILLIRSEIRKREHNSCVTFENHEGNPKCFMNIGNISIMDPTTQDLQRLTGLR